MRIRLCFTNGLPVKVQCVEYVRFQLVGVTEKMVLEEYLTNGVDFTSLLECIPDEFNAWLQQTVAHVRAVRRH